VCVCVYLEEVLLCSLLFKSRLERERESLISLNDVEMPLERSARPRRISTQRSECFLGFCFVFSIFWRLSMMSTHTKQNTHFYFECWWGWLWTGSSLFQIGGEPIFVSFLFAYQMIKSLWEIHVRWNFATLQSHLLYLAEAVCCPFGALDNPYHLTHPLCFSIFPVVNMISLLSPLK
jgi:hypothetical protein